MVRIVRQPGCGPRNYVLGHRLHHGMIGAGVVAAGVVLHNPLVVAAGVTLMVHDWHDFPWLTDCGR